MIYLSFFYSTAMHRRTEELELTTGGALVVACLGALADVGEPTL